MANTQEKDLDAGDRAINFLIAGTAACIAFYRNPDPFALPTTKN